MKRVEFAAWVLIAGSGNLLAVGNAAADWNPKAAAAYLDKRAEWWTSWPGAARDQGTFCISCHTPLPYVLARPLLRAALEEKTEPPFEQKILNNVIKRVQNWQTVKPIYGDQVQAGKGAESRGTEAVLNALILANCRTSSGNAAEATRAAFSNMWALQQTEGSQGGAWNWLQFNNEPWEAHDSAYYGAAIAAVAASAIPEEDRQRPDVRKHLLRLRDYLNREYPRQSLINRVVVLWASAKWVDLLAPERRSALVEEIVNSQRSDGGWSLTSLAWTWRNWNARSFLKMWVRADGTPIASKSDGYATGLITFVLPHAGFQRTDTQVKRGLYWLAVHQNKADGFWQAYSLNSHHAGASPTDFFMNDAATAYAVLALLSK